MGLLQQVLTIGAWTGTVADWLILLGILIGAWIFWLPLLFVGLVDFLKFHPRATVRWLYFGLFLTIVAMVVFWHRPPYYDFFTTQLAYVTLGVIGLLLVVVLLLTYQRSAE